MSSQARIVARALAVGVVALGSKAAAVAKTGGGLKAVLGLMAAGGVTAAAVQSGQAPDAADGSVAPAPSPATPRIPKFAQEHPPK